MFYMMYWVLLGLHEETNVSFLPVGRTKFSLDWCFGWLAETPLQETLGCLDDLVRVVNESASPNVVQLVGSQSGNVKVPI